MFSKAGCTKCHPTTLAVRVGLQDALISFFSSTSLIPHNLTSIVLYSTAVTHRVVRYLFPTALAALCLSLSGRRRSHTATSRPSTRRPPHCTHCNSFDCPSRTRLDSTSSSSETHKQLVSPSPATQTAIRTQPHTQPTAAMSISLKTHGRVSDSNSADDAAA